MLGGSHQDSVDSSLTGQCLRGHTTGTEGGADGQMHRKGKSLLFIVSFFQ